MNMGIGCLNMAPGNMVAKMLEVTMNHMMAKVWKCLNDVGSYHVQLII